MFKLFGFVKQRNFNSKDMYQVCVCCHHPVISPPRMMDYRSLALFLVATDLRGVFRAQTMILRGRDGSTQFRFQANPPVLFQMLATGSGSPGAASTTEYTFSLWFWKVLEINVCIEKFATSEGGGNVRIFHQFGDGCDSLCG